MTLQEIEKPVGVTAPSDKYHVAAKLRDDFGDQGYVIARGLFTLDEMRQFIDAVKGTEKTRSGSETLDDGTMRFYSNIFRESDTVRHFITAQPIIDFMAPIVGPDMWVRWDQAVA